MALDVLRLLWLIHVPYSLDSLHISSAMYITSRSSTSLLPVHWPVRRDRRSSEHGRRYMKRILRKT